MAPVKTATRSSPWRADVAHRVAAGDPDLGGDLTGPYAERREVGGGAGAIAHLVDALSRGAQVARGDRRRVQQTGPGQAAGVDDPARSPALAVGAGHDVILAPDHRDLAAQLGPGGRRPRLELGDQRRHVEVEDVVAAHRDAVAPTDQMKRRRRGQALARHHPDLGQGGAGHAVDPARAGALDRPTVEAHHPHPGLGGEGRGRCPRGPSSDHQQIDLDGLRHRRVLSSAAPAGVLPPRAMCGIAGFVDTDGMDRASGEALARAMATPLTPRGPDDSGAWSNGTVGLGFRRLAIVDLSPAGHQPMTSASGHLTITFNGEIYNHGELRAELAGRGARFRGRSDTEVLLAAIETWGVAATLPRLRGMFAFAVWDARDRSLTLARDRFGEKPLYLGWARDRRLFVFGSQLAALRAHPDVELTIDRAALLGFVRYSYVPHPRSIYEGLGKLPPGTWQRVWADGRATAPTSYYSLAAVAEANLAARTDVDLGDAAAQVEAALTRAVREQMVADVPLGAFLSGGIDSSLIVMLMQRHAQTPVRTFSIGFDQAAYDESAYARDVASRLGTEHTEFHVTGADALAIVPDLPDIYDEPFADSSQLPTTLVARLARRHVTGGPGRRRRR
jgi:asparagine synthase (glutamine-hydrolysing)